MVVPVHVAHFAGFFEMTQIKIQLYFYCNDLNDFHILNRLLTIIIYFIILLELIYKSFIIILNSKTKESMHLVSIIIESLI